MPLIRRNIVFQNLNQDTQDEIWEKVQKALVETGEVEREKGETDDKFRDRLWETTDDYINRYNFGQVFEL